MEKLYYVAPSDHLFKEMKKKAVAVWMLMDDPCEANENIDRIRGMQNIRDNFMTILAMFDDQNQRTLLKFASPELKQAIQERILTVA